MRFILHPIVMWLVVKEFKQVKGHMALLSLSVYNLAIYMWTRTELQAFSNALIIRWHISQYANIRMISLYFKNAVVGNFPIFLLIIF